MKTCAVRFDRSTSVKQAFFVCGKMLVSSEQPLGGRIFFSSHTHEFHLPRSDCLTVDPLNADLIIDQNLLFGVYESLNLSASSSSSSKSS